MKKLALALVVGIALLSFVVSVHAEGTESYYYSGDFLTKEWKEKMEEKCFDGAYLDPAIAQTRHRRALAAVHLDGL